MGFCEWDYSISFKGAWRLGGIGSEGEEFSVDPYDFNKMRRIAAVWDLKGYTLIRNRISIDRGNPDETKNALSRF